MFSFQNNDSEEDMFGDYDSFAENSFLAQVDDLEQQYMQVPQLRKHASDLTIKDLCSGSIKHNKLSITTVGNFTELKVDEHTKNQSRHKDVFIEPEPDLLYDVPSSQVLYFENLQNSSNDLGDQSTKEKDWNSFSHKIGNEELPQNSTEHQVYNYMDHRPKCKSSYEMDNIVSTLQMKKWKLRVFK